MQLVFAWLVFKLLHTWMQAQTLEKKNRTSPRKEKSIQEYVIKDLRIECVEKGEN